MYYLDFPGKKMEVVLAGAVTTNQLEVTAHFFIHTPQETTTIRRGGAQVSTTNSTTDVTIVDAPVLQGYIINIHSLTIHNKDTATATVTVKIDDNGTEKILIKQAVSVGESLVYEDGFGWQVLSPITPPFVDTTAIVKGSTDATKLVRIEADGLTTATTRVATMPDADIKLSGHATGFTDTRIPFATGSTGGVLTDSANLTFNSGTSTLTTVNFSATGNATLGDATGDTHTVNGTLTQIGTAGSVNTVFKSAAGDVLRFITGSAGAGVTVASTNNAQSGRSSISISGSQILLSQDSGDVWAPVVKRKTADESVTSSTTLQNDDHLAFSIAANEEWMATFNLEAGALLTTTGIKLAITFPTGATVITSWFFVDDTAGARYNSATVAGSTLDFIAAIFLGNNAGFTGRIWVLNGANAGTVQLQFAQSTSSGSAVTLKKGSHMVAHRVA